MILLKGSCAHVFSACSKAFSRSKNGVRTTGELLNTCSLCNSGDIFFTVVVLSIGLLPLDLKIFTNLSVVEPKLTNLWAWVFVVVVVGQGVVVVVVVVASVVVVLDTVVVVVDLVVVVVVGVGLMG